MRWLEPKSHDQYKIREISDSLRIPPLISSILFDRGYTTRDEIKKFLYPSLSDLSDPFLLPGLERAVMRILTALKNREKIVLYGDYDVDGLSGTALLFLVLSRLGAELSYYIPNRQIEGYGLSISGIKKAKEENATLLITIDCGITNRNEVKYASSLGIDTIITDHHEPYGELPEAYAIINPKLPGAQISCFHLAGVGVAFKLAQGLTRAIGLDDEEIYQHLDLVALGTVADIVPIVNENRILTKFGLRALERTSKPGLRALMQKAHIWGEEIATWKIVFILAPRLNSTGRMSEPRASFELLTTFDTAKAEQYADFLENENRRRKQLDEDTFRDAVEKIESNPKFGEEKIIIIHDANWHIGVIGIVASRIVEKYFKPTVLITTKTGIGKGSGRSVPGFHLLKAINSCGDYLIKFGGHKQAAGISIYPEKIDQFRRAMLEYAETFLPDSTLVPSLKIDALITPDDLNIELLEWLELFSPYGPENMRVVFLIENAPIIGEPQILKQEHIKFRIKSSKRAFDVIGFNMKEKLQKLVSQAPAHIAFIVEKNEWYYGMPDIELKLKDIKFGDWRKE